jgi:hypothetical protein
MGLLDLLGKVGKAVSQVQDAIKDASEQINSQLGNAQPQQRPAAQPVARQDFSDDDGPDYGPQGAKAYFAQILATEFPGYGVAENVPVTDLAGFANDSFQLYKSRPYQAYKAEWGAPYTFVLYAGGGPKGIVMLGDGHSHCSNVKYLIARAYAKKLGLPYINFYTQMPNERDYVISRIRRFLG